MKDWIAQLEDEALPKEDAIPPGFKSVKEIAARRKCGIYGAQHWVRLILATGKIRRIVLRRRTKTGVILVPYYGPK